jgi:ElaB/YqjD/DUF883 family membrane-anchored ribosome-binding protein
MARKIETAPGETLEALNIDEQVEALRKEIGELTKIVGSLVATKSASIGAKAAETMERASAQANEFSQASLDSLHAAADRTKDASLAVVDAVSEEVRKNPARALAVTLGIGLLSGLWSRSRS